MYYRIFITILLFLTTGKSYGQNLVNNPSFELVNSVDAKWSGTASKFNRNIKQWNSPSQGSPDLLYIKFLHKIHPKREKISLKNYTPRTGKFMVGLKTYGCQTNTLHCKEYLQNPLKQPLKVGRKYYYEYWVCPASTSVKVNSFGIGLSTKRVNQISSIGILELNTVFYNEERIDGDSTKWFKVSGIFESDSSYTHFIIGNFRPDESIDFKEEVDGIDYGYYLIDDVVLKPKDIPKEKPFKIREPIILRDILFETNKAIIQGINNPTLDDLAKYLQVNSKTCVRIEGHTDAMGSESYNLTLSERRANAVKNYLVQKGISSNRFNTFGMGSTKPLVKNDSERNRKINRRVEVIIEESMDCN